MLLKRIEGYFFETTETIIKTQNDGNGNDVLIPIAIKKTKKYSHPSDRLIIFVLKKLYPEKYGDQNVVINNMNPINRYKGLSIDEINAEIKLIEDRIGRNERSNAQSADKSSLCRIHSGNL